MSYSILVTSGGSGAGNSLASSISACKANHIPTTVATPTSMDSSSPTSLDPASGGIAQLPMRQMSGGGTVRYNEGGGITIQDVREMLGMPREGFDQRENYPPYYDDDGNIIGYDTRTELGKKLGPKFNYEPPIQNKSEGGSIYNNPYFGNADPEEVKKLQEQNPNLSTEDAVAMILGIDTADITPLELKVPSIIAFPLISMLLALYTYRSRIRSIG